jgi:hypothetical protein
MKLKKNQLTKDAEHDSSELRLTRQTCDTSHETEINSYKVNKNKSQNLIFNQFNVE